MGAIFFESLFLVLLVFPLLVFLGCMMFYVVGLPLQVAVLSASVATASNGYMLAREMNNAEPCLTKDIMASWMKEGVTL